MQSLPTLIVSLVLLAAVSGCSQEPTSSDDKAAHSHGHDYHGAHDGHKDADAAPASRHKASADKRSAKAHSHGDAKLALVLDGSIMTAAFETPLFNILGFEHKAETQAQKAAVIEAQRVLAVGARLFTFNSQAECAPANESISVELGGHDDDYHDDPHDDKENEEEGVHKDIALEYIFTCHHPEQLKDITVNLFEHFEHMDEIELIYLGPDTQKQDVLNRKKTRVKLSRS